MKIIPYEPRHLLEIEPQKSQESLERTQERAEQLATYQSFTGVIDGRVVAIGGLVELNPIRAYLYLIVTGDIPHQWTQLYRSARRLINAGLTDYIRLETLSAFPEADRWLELIGFKYEGTMRRAGPDGCDAKMYSIVRD
ncbi:hypothetical protein M2403_002044 [Rahnella sp. BIGb0603]|uniref:hypothetical protein n=1 Tax=Rahnella sp. BIGb0603 TaxID=2940612 RepID=UPI002167C2AC|nr:hypothetical protein [Rahnella sp. BIGb0603]MCS3423443.1 hypothetical protein [Rahnella sp. BIGb0603]